MSKKRREKRKKEKGKKYLGPKPVKEWVPRNKSKIFSSQLRKRHREQVDKFLNFNHISRLYSNLRKDDSESRNLCSMFLTATRYSLFNENTDRYNLREKYMDENYKSNLEDLDHIEEGLSHLPSTAKNFLDFFRIEYYPRKYGSSNYGVVSKVNMIIPAGWKLRLGVGLLLDPTKYDNAYIKSLSVCFCTNYFVIPYKNLNNVYFLYGPIVIFNHSKDSKIEFVFTKYTKSIYKKYIIMFIENTSSEPFKLKKGSEVRVKYAKDVKFTKQMEEITHF